MLPQYEEEHITRTEAMDLSRGDKLVFIDPRSPENRRGEGASLHEKVVTFRHLDIGQFSDGIEVDECRGTHFVLRCYHKIIEEPNIAEEDFNAVFT